MKEAEFPVGMILYTKDGRKIGNAIIIDVWGYWNEWFYIIRTDFGNTLNLNYDEILNMFYVPVFKFAVYTPMQQFLQQIHLLRSLYSYLKQLQSSK